MHCSLIRRRKFDREYLACYDEGMNEKLIPMYSEVYDV